MGRPGGTYAQAERLLWLVDVLRREPEGVLLATLAARLGVDVRTVRRDLAALRAARVSWTAHVHGMRVYVRQAIEHDDRLAATARALAEAA